MVRGKSLENPMRFDQSLWDQFAGNRGAIMKFPRQGFAFSVAELVPSLLDGLLDCSNVAVAGPPLGVADERPAYRSISRSR
jgi:hypothetical protein